jgi:hypothetical protein
MLSNDKPKLASGNRNQRTMNLKMGTQQLESPESSSPIITRAVAAGLGGVYSAPYHFSGLQRAALRLLGYFPQQVARQVVSRFETISGLEPELLRGMRIDDLAQERLNDYAQLGEETFPALTIGAGLGGASAHLAMALGGPFLPQAFVTTLKGGSKNGDVRTYFQRSAELARQISANNPNIITIQHYDPVHDEWMTRYVNHLRFKLIDLPQVYIDFIHTHLQPGGAICYLDSQAKWLRYRVGERNFFQVGGWGDISPQEFLEGSARIEKFCKAVHLEECNWRLPGYPEESGPESEWGCEPGLGEALQAFCQQQGYRFVPISLPEPHHYSRLAYESVRHLLLKEDRQPAGVLIEMFSQYDVTAVMESGLLPLWLVFNTWDSLAFLKEMRAAFPHNKPVFFSPLSTFTSTPDLAPWEQWAQALEGLDWRNVGARQSHYPADVRALVHWQRPLHEWVSANRRSIRTRLQAEEILALAEEVSERHASGLSFPAAL